MGSIDLSWSINKELDSYINIYGSHGTICVGWKESKYRQPSSRDWVVFGKGYDKVQALPQPDRQLRAAPSAARSRCSSPPRTRSPRSR